MAENFIRSAQLPVTTAGVMMAKAIWNITNTLSGIVVGTGLAEPAPSVKALSQLSARPSSSTREKSPANPAVAPMPLVKAIE